MPYREIGHEAVAHITCPFASSPARTNRHMSTGMSVCCRLFATESWPGPAWARLQQTSRRDSAAGKVQRILPRVRRMHWCLGNAIDRSPRRARTRLVRERRSAAPLLRCSAGAPSPASPRLGLADADCSAFRRPDCADHHFILFVCSEADCPRAWPKCGARHGSSSGGAARGCAGARSSDKWIHTWQAQWKRRPK